VKKKEMAEKSPKKATFVGTLARLGQPELGLLSLEEEILYLA